MTGQRRAGDGAFIMLISAAIFGYFGWNMLSTLNGQVVFMFALLKWTLVVAAILFAVSGVLCFVAATPANLLYSVSGIASSISLAVVLVMDLLDSTTTTAIGPIFLAIFVAWNLYGSWSGLQSVLAARRAPGPSAYSPDE